MAIYYHVSKELTHDGIFTPRVPELRLFAENDQTPRICVSSTIEGCFSSIPGGGGSLEETSNSLGNCYRVFVIDTEVLGIKEHNIVTAQELYEKDDVWDAIETNEHWILTPFICENSMLIELEFWQGEEYYVYPHSISVLAEKCYEGDAVTAYEETIGAVPSNFKIEKLEYVTVM